MSVLYKIKWNHLLVLTLTLFSFFLFSPLYNNKYSSDNAVQVLMAHHFQFPGDLYYWGQDRLGSIVPLLAAWPVKWLGCSPIYAVSIVQYLLLLGGYLCFSYFIRNHWLKLALCFIWFFPLAIFEVHLQIGHPYAGQLFFLGFTLYIFEKSKTTKPGRVSLLFVFCSALSFMLSIWVSDLTLFILPFYLVYVLFSNAQVSRMDHRFNFSINTRLTRKMIFFLLGLGVGFFFLRLAKNSARMPSLEYDLVFSSISQIKAGFSTVTGAMGKALFFEVRNVLISFHTVFFFALFVLLFVHAVFFRPGKENEFQVRFLLFFSVLFTFLVVVCSHWVEVGLYDTRYFSFTYYLALVFLLVSIDQLRNRYFKWMAMSFSVPLVLCPAIDALIASSAHHNIAKHLTIKEIREISEELGDCGIIGDYWTSYNLASWDPQKIIASPRDEGPVRKMGLVPALMQKKKIYLVADNWLAVFPPACIQFGYFLQKKGEPFTTHGITLCQYERVEKVNYPVSAIGYQHAHLETGTEERVVKNDSTTYVQDFICFGPFITLRPGTYSFSVELSARNACHSNDSLTLDVTNSMGQILFLQKKFALNGKYAFRKKVAIKFEVTHFLRRMELRVFLKGKTQVCLEKIRLVREAH